ncbi:glycosyltransferase [Microbacterium luticocti]|uniref:glycosyltransferase n=1 Tax=Microbacterium luticocti TaxID=451764 RepID=UPI000405EB7D|nr:glycosyltransferase family 2 protein [Microbacterium luticocti]
MQLSIIVPTYNEAPNVAELVRRIAAAVAGIEAEIVFVDDSTDATPDTVRAVAADAPLPVRLIHRDVATGGLGGAVLEGLRAAAADECLVMDGDLQHPPEDIPVLRARFAAGDVDVVVASRYLGEGSAQGLADRTRVWVSRLSTMLTRAMFPLRLRGVSDPMTGFFLVDRRRLDLAGLRPRGFKILLEILARRSLRVAEVPFRFADRYAGQSKASVRQGVHFLVQLTALRFGKMSLFALIGALGAVANLAIMWALTEVGMHYIPAAIIGAEVTIVSNFVLQERFVFQDLRADASGTASRFAKSFAFNNVEAAVRIPVIALLVNTWHISSVIAAGITLVVAFVVRFMFHSLVVYAPRRAGAPSVAREIVDEIDAQAMSPGEL